MADKFKIGDKVKVHYPNGDKIGFIKEVKYDDMYDIDYGGGCTGHDIAEYLIEKDNSLDRIIEADRILNTAFGRGMAEVIAEKQARIDRLEQLIWMLYENIVKGVKSDLIDSDDMETHLCCEIRNKVKELNSDLETSSMRYAGVCTALGNAEDTIQKLKRKK